MNQVGAILVGAIRHHRCAAVVILVTLLYAVMLAWWFPLELVLALAPTAIAKVFVSVIAIYAVLSLLYYFFAMLFWIRPKSPIRFVLQRLGVFCGDRQRFLHFLYVVALFSVFATFFAINKAAIAKVSGFQWDGFFVEVDRFFFMGNLPHDALAWVFANPVSALALEVAYQAWFYLYYMSIVLVGYYLAFTAVARRYLLASVLTWFVGGNILALLFSSAGPIFPEIHQLGHYDAHLAVVENAVPGIGSFALTVKQRLYEMLSARGFSSISAFPSMHVASTLLMVFLSRHLGPVPFRCMVGFFVVIFLGSFALLWHYFIDAVAGAALAAGFWWLSGTLCRQDARLGRWSS